MDNGCYVLKLLIHHTSPLLYKQLSELLLYLFLTGKKKENVFTQLEIYTILKTV